MRILYNNKFDVASVVASTTNADYPVSNMVDQRLSTAWRSTDTSTQTVTIDLFDRTAVNVVSLLGHNCHSSSTITLNANTYNGFTSPAFTTTLTYNDDIILNFFTSQSYRYWQLSITNYIPVATAMSWQSVAWSPEKNLFAAVAWDGATRAMYSSTGVNWTQIDLGTANRWYSVCWSPEQSLFVSVAFSGNKTMYSSTGTAWTNVDVSTAAWRSVCWSPEKNLFVAVAESGTNQVLYSSTGTSWESVAVTASGWFSVCWSPELSLFVAVANAGTNRVMYSSTGTSWTDIAVTSSTWFSVCWSPEQSLFVAVANTGTYRLMYSSTGTAWTNVEVTASAWRNVTWSPDLNLFIALASDSTYRQMYSSTGTSWTNVEVTASTWFGSVWSPEKNLFVALANAGTFQVMHSSNGTSWVNISGVDGYIQLGRVFIGEYLDISPSSLLDFTVTKKRSDVVIYGKDRHKFANQGVGWREFKLNFPSTKTTMLTAIQTMYDTVGNFKSLIFCNFDTDRNYQIVEPCYCSVVGDIAFNHQRNMKFKYSLTLEEDR